MTQTCFQLQTRFNCKLSRENVRKPKHNFQFRNIIIYKGSNFYYKYWLHTTEIKSANRRDTSFSGTKNLIFNENLTSCRLYTHFQTDAFNILKQITASNIQTFQRRRVNKFRLPVYRCLYCRKQYLLLKSIKGMYKLS